MVTLQRLEQALQNAHNAGDEAAARQIASEIRRLQAAPPEEERYNALMDDTSVLDRVLIGIGRGAVDVGQGISQLARHAAELIPGVDAGAADYDRRIAEEAAMFNRDAEGSIAARVGRVGGNIAATALPAGAAAKVASVGAKGLNAALRAGASAGAVEAGLLADTDGESGLLDRAVQSGVGAALGAAGGGVVEGGRRLLQGAVNAPRDLINAATTGQGGERGLVGRLDSSLRGNRRVRAQGEAAQRELGVEVLTPAELSGSSAAKMAENLSRQSYFTMDRARLADTVRIGRFVRRISRMARRLGNEGDNVTVAKQIQGATRNMVNDMAKARSEFGRKAYGAVDKAAGGAPVVEMTRTRRAIADIVEQYKAGGTDDANRIASRAAARLEELGEGPLTTRQALNYLHQWTDASRGSGNLFADIDRANGRRLARQLADAAMADLEDVAVKGGTVGDLVRQANEGWRQHSTRIETLKNSVLGQVLGEEFADEISGVAFNRMAPEKVFDRLKGANPSELKVAMGYLDESAPEVAGNFRRSLIENAIMAAREAPPSAGPNPLPLNPGAFIRELQGGASGGRAVKGMKRLEVIFGETKEWPKIQAAFQIAERMADSIGKNFSGTAAANQFYQVLGSLYGSIAEVAQKVAGNAASLVGLNQVARQMMPGVQALPRFAVPQGAVTGTAGASGLLAGAAAPSLTERERQNNR